MAVTKLRNSAPTAATPQQSTISANPNATPRQDRATWGEQADILARNHARAAVYRWGPVLLLLLALGGLAAHFLADVTPRALAAPLAAILAGCVAILAGLWSWVYARELDAGTQATWRATWAKEEEEGRDIDGDGVIGDPFRTITVRRRDRVEEVPFSLPRNSERGQPIMDGWGVSKADLVAILYEAELTRGLQERAWVGPGADPFVLPSGRQVTQVLFRGVLAALAEHDFASKRANRWELDVTADDVAHTLRNST